MATSLTHFPFERIAGTMAPDDNSIFGLAQSAILRGSSVSISVAFLALAVFVSPTKLFSCAILALCLQLFFPVSCGGQHGSILQSTGLARVQVVLERLLQKLLRKSLQHLVKCLFRLAELVREDPNPKEGFGKRSKPSPKQLYTTEQRLQLTSSRPLKAQRGTRGQRSSRASSYEFKQAKYGVEHYLLGRRAARGDHYGQLPLEPQDIPRPLLERRSPPSVQGLRSLISQSSHRSPEGDSPPRPLHPSQPYRALLPAPPEAPRGPSITTPPKGDFTQVVSPRAAAQPFSSSAVYTSPQVQGRSNRLTASPKHQGNPVQHSLLVVDASEYKPPQRAQPGPTLKGTSASLDINGHLPDTAALPQLAAGPDGITYCVGETSRKRARGNQSSSRSQGNASERDTNGNGGSSIPPSGDDPESANEERNPNQNKKRASESKETGPHFRCPRYCANPREYGDPKCKHWRGRSIHDVTRHALKDAAGDAAKREKLQEYMRLSPRERWERYVEIFSDGTETDQINDPYWPDVDAEDLVTNFLSGITDQMRRNIDAVGGLGKIQQFNELLMEKKLRDERIRFQYQVEKTAAMERKYQALQASRRELAGGIEALLGGGTSETALNPTALVERQNKNDLVGLAPPINPPIQRSHSGQGSEVDMSRLDCTVPMAQTQAMGVSNNAMPAIYQQNYYSPSQQRANKVITIAEDAMDGTGNPNMANACPPNMALNPPPPTSNAFSSPEVGYFLSPNLYQPMSSASSAQNHSHSHSGNYGVTSSWGTSSFDPGYGPLPPQPRNGNEGGVYGYGGGYHPMGQ
ncbi:hypothetical protein Z517_00731 [Fonsecaea pedrosoi CBS 271.37]|uniref:Uncharacterized protein n=1 Tax=Fonsecaea pedrosoi CBS 271.37 TaxID=1442368 RepID=A0A0D2E5G3_9EURO|nr:uncharacterized protein Z517_00731 [Fonsecaea pedrosoi CBS 271.37]KIW85341.1 hypothetical protein Z517_00731 [Fonsecaea pedrosoi CBS 271.37]